MGATGNDVPGQLQPLACREATVTGAHRRDQHEASTMNLPPGFRFHPTDEELAIHYLGPKALDPGFTAAAMGDVDLNKFEPWELQGRVKMVGGTQQNPEMYLFNQRDKKYPTGTRTNRATERGYWKATGKDKEIYSRVGNRRLIVGMKKTLVFYTGRAPKGGKTDWVMHEYRLDKADGHPERSYWAAVLNRDSAKMQDEWVVCRVFLKPKSASRRPLSAGEQRVEADSDDVSDDPSANEPSADEPPPLVEPLYTEYGTGVTVKYAMGDTLVANPDIEAAPANVSLSSHIGNMAVALNNKQHYGGGSFGFSNHAQSQLMMMIGGSTMGSGQFNNRVPNFMPPVSSFSPLPIPHPQVGPMNPLPPLVNNNDHNMVYGPNAVKNLGDLIFTGPLHRNIGQPIRMIPTPQTPRQCKQEELTVPPLPVEMMSPDSSVMSGPGGSYASLCGSSVQEMTSGGGGSIYSDAVAEDDLLLSGVMMNLPNNWP